MTRCEKGDGYWFWRPVGGVMLGTMTKVQTLHERLIALQSDEELQRKAKKAMRSGL